MPSINLVNSFSKLLEKSEVTYKRQEDAEQQLKQQNLLSAVYKQSAAADKHAHLI